ncbi:Fe(3+)-hydroxamate ABC transporter substrate-binding protein FhuD [Serratia ficaria]|uniref:Iron(III)-hydroxamate-binding protein fhuD n=1 Tax=Serratia ficaria TaxID=61651 RepID=A0A240CAD9_SERFI|nr:Fe(3+)-hydroxamate ABC transporter substrate-binding protein FhuD [Serratia ficaria]MEE4485546.1 Fe(3+)-hydroxamate ABC transporter substrate-binding protein FhuD [Serratia ficaria]REF43179.1 iron complex transport system substrate-binding protein [Serratia ficaria]CAI1049599.1 Iron(III)-hydroxamate-binding protein fhuD [Serratia ficaria]CAI1074980.1 Iron(III)-hydroxamate-binding protein fhuD [Serratia ficaria]CAI1164001.1 Iron(III)-hydroxamate-binding protein fhuD [Serratia ficaria]
MSASNLSSPDPLRRRLLAAMALSPLLFSLPGRAADAPPDIARIAALEWLPVELLLALGVMPLAVADIHNYNLWVEEPKLPASVVDVGQRTEPNLELLQQLKPSLVLLSQGYGPTPQKLQPIAPTMSFGFNDGSGKPLTVARQSLQALAQRLGLETRAVQHLAQFDRFIQDARRRLQAYTRQPLLMFSLIDSRHALVIGQKSLFQEVMDRLGIKNAWEGETNFWGTAVVGIERLMSVSHARAIYLDHGNQAMLDKVSATPLWRALPFVRQNQLRQVPAVWFYGATLSAMRFCRVLEQAQERNS